MAMIPNRLVIFSRTPRAGTVKTRLARHIGYARAAQFVRHAIAKLLRELASDPRWHTCLALTERTHVPYKKIPVLYQGTGDMGARLSRLVGLARTANLVIIGSDTPHVKKHHIARAFKLFGNHAAVFGPATDGGFWLAGFRHGHKKISLKGVRFSTPHALADTVANLPKKPALLQTLSDVDTVADYTRYFSWSRGISSTKLHGRKRESN